MAGDRHLELIQRLSLSVFLSVSLSLCLCLSVSVSVSLFLSLSLPVCLSVSLFMNAFASMYLPFRNCRFGNVNNIGGWGHSFAETLTVTPRPSLPSPPKKNKGMFYLWELTQVHRKQYVRANENTLGD